MVINMQNLGIIAEYNPFHNGHKFHIDKTKSKLNIDSSICIISGNFTQRGEPCLYSKWEKTKMALSNGIDLVIEMPTYYAVNSAQNFATCGIELLNSLGIIDYVSFGTECNDIEILKQLSDVLLNEPDEYKEELKKQLSMGNLFAKSNELAVLKVLGDDEFKNILSSPNNILAIEYLKALEKLNSKIIPFNIERTNDYLSLDINSDICSATAIRTALEKDIHTNLENVVSLSTCEIMRKNTPKFLKDFETQIIYMIRKMDLKSLNDILEVTEGLDIRLKKFSFETNDIYELIHKVKTKRFTQTKIQRILIHILLGMTKTEFENIQKNNYMYIRVLGMNSKGKELLKKISTTCNIPVISSLKKYIDTYGSNPLLEKDILSSNIYYEKYNIDMTEKIITM